MKVINKLILLVLISLVMVACTPKKKPPTTDPYDNNTEVTEPKTNTSSITQPLTGHQFGGKTKYGICCDSSDLNNQDSLLSERVILFGYDQSTVDAHYRVIVDIHAKYLRQNPSARMVLEGHADERGSPEYNLALGERRGKSIASMMRAQGVSSDQLSVVSFGEEKPVALCNNNSCWSQNRRVRIVYTAN